MNAKVIEQAIAKIASASEEIETYCNDPNNRCSPDASSMLERMSWELYKQANELREIKYLYVS